MDGDIISIQDVLQCLGGVCDNASAFRKPPEQVSFRIKIEIRIPVCIVKESIQGAVLWPFLKICPIVGRQVRPVYIGVDIYVASGFLRLQFKTHTEMACEA